MKGWDEIPFAKLVVESRDGEWGQADAAVGYRLAEVIRGTDFSDINSPNKELPNGRVTFSIYCVQKQDHIKDT
jgi:hypothetical protein